MVNLNPFDIIVLAILVLSAFWGGMRGVVSQITTIASWIVSWFVASRYYGFIESFISPQYEWRTLAATVATFVLCAMAIRIIAHFIKSGMAVVGLNEFDRQVGALFGVAKGALLCVLITFFCVIATERTRNLVNNSKSGPFFVSIIGKAESVLPDSEIKAKISSMIKDKIDSEKAGKALDSNVDFLKSYLKRNVLSETAAEIVNEADMIEKSGEKNANSTNRLRKLRSQITSQLRKARATATEETNEAVSEVTGMASSELAEAARPAPAVTTAVPARSADDGYAYAAPANSAPDPGVLSEDGELYSRTVQLYTDQNGYSSVNNLSAPNYANNGYSNSNAYDGGYSTPSEYAGPDYAQSSSVYPQAASGVVDTLTNSGTEFGFHSYSTNSEYDRPEYPQRRRLSGRTASSVRLGSYSYSSNY